MSTKQKWTEGPWRTQSCSNGGLILLRGDKYHVQSHLQILPEEDARLIAAAPDMARALRLVYDNSQEWANGVVVKLTHEQWATVESALRAQPGRR